MPAASSRPKARRPAIASSASASASASPAPAPEAIVPGPANRRLGTLASSSVPAGNAVAGSSRAPAEKGKDEGFSKLKFVPRARNTAKVIDDDDGDVKMEDGTDQKKRGATTSSRGRGRGRGQPLVQKERVEVRMSASGPMGQGPRMAPNAKKSGTSGVSAGLGHYEDAHELDASDLEEDQGRGDVQKHVRAVDLNLIGEEDEMAPLTLPQDPQTARLATSRRMHRTQARTKALLVIKPEPGLEDDKDKMDTSGSGTPPTPVIFGNDQIKHLFDNVPMTLAEKLEGLSHVPPETIDMTNDFMLDEGAREQLYMFQFPRQFPRFVVEKKTPSSSKVKQEDEVDRKPRIIDSDAPEWGRAGSAAEKATRWQDMAGKIGKLRVHQSGRITMKIKGDLTFEVLPAAQPTFLQEIAIIKPSDKIDGKVVPGSLTAMGQTNKKFMVVPTVEHLLARIKLEEEEDKRRREEAKLKRVKAEK